MNWLLLAAGIIGWIFVWKLAAPPSATGMSSYYWGCFVFLSGYLGLNISSPQSPDAARIAIAVQVLGYLLVIYSSPSNLTFILLVILAGELPFLFSSRITLALLSALHLIAVAIVTIYWAVPFLHALTDGSLFLGFELFALAVSQIAVRETTQRQTLEMKQAQLLSTRELLQQSVQQGERLRISRDLHDICGHQLTALALNLEYASQLPATTAHEQVKEARVLAEELLQKIRWIVRGIRQPSINLATALDKLILALPNADIRVIHDNDLSVLNNIQADNLLCLCQEAVSNALRHGVGYSVRLEFNVGAHELEVNISNPVRRKNVKKAISYDGSGLTTIVERAKHLGGDAKFSTGHGYFTVNVCIPLKEDLYDPCRHH